MDTIDRTILSLLAADARRGLAEIGAHVGLSTSAVNERVRRLVAGGAIRRFTVDADPAALGHGVLAFVSVGLADGADEEQFRHAMALDASVEECHHVTGRWSYLVKVRSGSLAGVEAFLARLKADSFIGRSETVIALSSAVDAAHVPKDASG